ncbi:MAG: hypothetical protein HQM08_29935 [Candidatus Riflebacteria bacterium]|nr:hypothetical protein [Candidatus Riflebacteria bacterium]
MGSLPLRRFLFPSLFFLYVCFSPDLLKGQIPINSSHAQMPDVPEVKRTLLVEISSSSVNKPRNSRVAFQDVGKLHLSEEQNIRLKSIEFRDVNVHDALHSILCLSGINHIIDPRICGNLTVIWNDFRLQDAVNSILVSQGLVCRWIGDILLISLNENSFVTTETIVLRNRKVEEVQGIVSDMISRGVGTFSIDVSSNSVKITNTKPIVDACKLFLSMIDYTSRRFDSFGTSGLFKFGENEVALGKDQLVIRMETSNPKTPIPLIRILRSDYVDHNTQKIADFKFNSSEIGSGTLHPVQVICDIYLSAYDKVTGQHIDFSPK